MLRYEFLIGCLVHEIGKFAQVLEFELHEPAFGLGGAVDQRRIS